MDKNSISRAQRLSEVKKLADSGEVEAAWNIVEELMLEEPNHGLSVMMGAYTMHRAKRLSLAYYLARQAVELEPGQVQTWMELGHAAKHIWQMEEAANAFRRAIQMTENPELKAMNFSNLASVTIETGRFKAAEPMCLEALRLKPDHAKSRANYAMCLLARGDWKGWDYYSACLDTPQRARKPIGTEPEWNGEKDSFVFVVPEQGMGDEISFASMFPDLIKDSSRVVIECEPKLEGLFERSFPKAKVYGTRRGGRERWEEIDRHPDYFTLAGELGKFYRRKDEDFPGTQYLTADPDRRVMWRALFDYKRKPVIGVAWTGGIYNTGRKLRRFDLSQLLPIFRSVDAHWVSLQYQDATEEIEAFKREHGIEIVQYPYATLTPDYDDTAALVAELDSVVCMQTCVGHLAGSLGKEAYIFVPERSQWRYGEVGDRMIWYKSVHLMREKNGWAGPVDRVANTLRTRYARVKAA